MNKILPYLIIFTLLGGIAMAQDQKPKSKEKPAFFKFTPEFKINYSKNILNQDFDFNLKTVEEGKFQLSYYNSNERFVTVKIYDFIGNLILQERVSTQGLVNREYDLSFSKTKLFIVEVGNAKYNKTKSVMAI